MCSSVPDGANRSRIAPAGGDEAGGPDRGIIEALRASIRSLEHVPVSFGHPPAPEAPLARPACLSVTQGEETGPLAPEPPPLHRLAEPGLHELKPETYADTPAAIGFALSLLALKARSPDANPSSSSPLLWCLTEAALAEWGAPYGPGLLSLGLDLARLIIVKAGNAREAAWALEEGLKSGALSGLLGQAAIEKPVMARRLGLAAKAGGVPCLLVTEGAAAALPGSVSRWRIAAAVSGKASLDQSAPGPPAWRLTLERCRNERPERRWHLEWSDETHGFRLSPPLAHRTADAGATQSHKARK